MKNSSIHILVIEDDPQIRNFISYVLKQEEFLCTAVGTAQAGMSELVRADRFDDSGSGAAGL